MVTNVLIWRKHYVLPLAWWVTLMWDFRRLQIALHCRGQCVFLGSCTVPMQLLLVHKKTLLLLPIQEVDSASGKWVCQDVNSCGVSTFPKQQSNWKIEGWIRWIVSVDQSGIVVQTMFHCWGQGADFLWLATTYKSIFRNWTHCGFSHVTSSSSLDTSIWLTVSVCPLTFRSSGVYETNRSLWSITLVCVITLLWGMLYAGNGWEQCVQCLLTWCISLLFTEKCGCRMDIKQGC